MPDGQFCIIKESQELVRFIGNMSGDYACELGVIEDSFGYMKIVRLSDIQSISAEEAQKFDHISYEILCENDQGVYDE